MIVTRRGFLDCCVKTAGALGLAGLTDAELSRAIANPAAPRVLWLQGATCSGCSTSFLDHVSSSPPVDASEVLLTGVNLLYHPVLMGASGSLATSVVADAYATGNYVLAVEGGIPTAFGGQSCTVWIDGSGPVAVLDAVRTLATRARAVVSIGTCASWGGVAAVGPNLTGTVGVSAAIGRQTVNLAGCPAHPSWIVSGLLRAITDTVGTLDADGRPTALYSFPYKLHYWCPREPKTRVTSYGVDRCCQRYLGCKGPATYASCTQAGWNHGASFCTEASAICLGCVNRTFPGTAALRLQTK